MDIRIRVYKVLYIYGLSLRVGGAKITSFEVISNGRRTDVNKLKCIIKKFVQISLEQIR